MIPTATSNTAVYQCKVLHLFVYFKYPVTVTSQHMMNFCSRKYYIITCCASNHRGCTCYKATRRLALLAEFFLPKDPALLLWALQVSSR